jgi:hypothetical protein
MRELLPSIRVINSRTVIAGDCCFDGGGFPAGGAETSSDGTGNFVLPAVVTGVLFDNDVKESSNRGWRFSYYTVGKNTLDTSSVVVVMAEDELSGQEGAQPFRSDNRAY